MFVKPQVNQSVGTYTNLLLRININIKELGHGCGTNYTPMNMEVDRCEVNEDDQDYEDDECHTPIPDPTRMADPNRVQGARLYTGTLYLFFFSQS